MAEYYTLPLKTAKGEAFSISLTREPGGEWMPSTPAGLTKEQLEAWDVAKGDLPAEMTGGTTVEPKPKPKPQPESPPKPVVEPKPPEPAPPAPKP